MEKQKREVYHHGSHQIKTMRYLHLNVIEYYSNHMNNFDIMDQLRGHYQPDHWMQHKKWWWVVFNWGISMVQVNAYKLMW
jgi:hypothetical protein